MAPVLCLFACKSGGSDNPYDDWQSTPKAPVVTDKSIDPNTIQGLHKNIFKPTCSNSGCHDGNFEPDFRTVESSYNSLINRLATNTDPGNAQYVRRVVPGNAAVSMLLHRMSTFIPGSQGVMPLTVDPGSDWPAKSAEYIQNITNWINAGAKDQFGNSPSDIDFTPQMGGMIVFADGAANPIPRSGYNPVSVPAGTNTLKIMFAFLDDKTPVNQFGPGSLNFTLNPYAYDSTSVSLVRESTPFSAKGVSGATLDYWHSVTVNSADIGAPGDVIWLRAEVTDNVNPPVFIPAGSASFNFVKYFAIRLN